MFILSLQLMFVGEKAFLIILNNIAEKLMNWH